MLLYKKQFSLSDDISVSNFIRELDDRAFPPYVLKVEKIPKRNKFNVRPILMFHPTQWGVVRPHGGMVLNNCAIEFSRNKKEFTLTGISTGWSLFNAVFYFAMSLTILLFTIFYAIPHGISLGDFIFALFIALLLLYPASNPFLRERKLLDKIGRFGMEITRP